MSRLCGVALLITLFLTSCSNIPATSVIPTNTPSSASNSCETLVTTALNTLDTVCEDVGRNQACYGNTRIDAILRDNSSATFTSAGDTVGINDLESMSLSALDIERNEWGFAILQVQANLPDTLPGQNVTFMLFGGTQITPEGQVDGLQSFYIRTGLGAESPCNIAPEDGVIIQTPDTDIEVMFNLNGVQFELGSTAYVRAEPSQQMIINLIEGQAVVSAQGASQTVMAGTRTTISLDEQGIANDVPTSPEPYQTSDIRALPVRTLIRQIQPAPPAVVTQTSSVAQRIGLSTQNAPDAGVVQGEITTTGEEVLYEIDLEAGQVIFLDGDDSGEPRINWHMIAPDSIELISGQSVRFYNRPIEIEQTGTYQIIVFGISDSIGPYSFNLWGVPDASEERLELSSQTPTQAEGEITIPGEEVIYDVELETGQVIFLDGDDSGEPNIVWDMQAPDGTEIISSQNVRFYNRPIEIEQTGTHRIVIFGQGDTIGIYAFTLWDVPDASEARLELLSETLAEARGEIAVPGEEIIYDVDLEAGQVIFLDGDDSGEPNMRWDMLASDGTEIISEQNVRFYNQPIEIEQTGTYRIIVFGPGDVVGTYAFTLWDVPDASEETIELSVRTATEISGEITVPGEEAIYDIDLEAGQMIVWEGDDSGEVNMQWDMLAPDGTELFSGQNVRFFDDTIEIEQTGTYRLIISGQGDVIGKYSFTLTENQP